MNLHNVQLTVYINKPLNKKAVSTVSGVLYYIYDLTTGDCTDHVNYTGMARLIKNDCNWTLKH